ncbi:MAG: Iodothyronine deiodinase [Planctomycetaceae bacterium]|nr:Iodothyronine deiodinase [Planctomycetaceae bacterium]
MSHRAIWSVLFICSHSIMVLSNATAQESPKQPAAPGTEGRSPAAAAARTAAVPLKEVEQAYAGTAQPESVKMLLAIARGSKMGPGEGWFGPAATRFNWKWLSESQGLADADSIPADKFHGSERWFGRLDRNKDGRITATILTGQNGIPGCSRPIW